MKTLHPAYRVSDLAVSLGFYTALGYGQVGRVDVGGGASLTMLKLPGDEVVTLELVHRPADRPVEIGTGFSHLAVQVDDMAAAIETLSQAGLRAGPIERPGGPDGPQTSWLTDPDGYRIELVRYAAHSQRSCGRCQPSTVSGRTTRAPQAERGTQSRSTARTIRSPVDH